jgi:Na+-transporting NADH:ubiquinone oxidoreductase subunit C
VDTSKPSYVIVYTLAISAAFTAAVMSVQVAFQGKIQRNKELREQRALVYMFGLVQEDAATLSEEQITGLYQQRITRGEEVTDPESGQPYELIRAFKSERKEDLLAIGFPVGGNGLWAPIRGFMALKPDLRQVHGAVFVEHQETPGLGGRITEQWFQDQFRKVTLPETNEPKKLLYVAQTEPKGPEDPRYGRSVDAITGATQTSNYLEAFVNEDLKRVRRAIQAAKAETKTASIPGPQTAMRTAVQW